MVVGTAVFGAPRFCIFLVEKCFIFQGFGQKSGRPKNGRSYHHPSHPPVDAFLEATGTLLRSFPFPSFALDLRVRPPGIVWKENGPKSKNGKKMAKNQNSPDRGQSRKLGFSKFPGSGLKKFSELCFLLFCLGKSDKMLPKPGFSKRPEMGKKWQKNGKMTPNPIFSPFLGHFFPFRAGGHFPFSGQFFPIFGFRPVFHSMPGGLTRNSGPEKGVMTRRLGAKFPASGPFSAASLLD